MDNIARPQRDSSRGLQGCTICQRSAQYMTVAALGAEIGFPTLLSRPVTQLAEKAQGAGDQLGII